MQTALTAFFASPAGIAVYSVLGIALLDFILGVFAAIRDKTFQLDAVAAWLRKHIAGRVMPIVVMLIFGYFGQQDIISAGAAAMAALYGAETLGSIMNSWGPNRAVQPVPTD